MPRMTAAVVSGAAVVLLTWVSAPAAPTPMPAPIPADVIAAIDALAPLASEVGQETEKLKARLETVVAPPSPRRDPFAFGEPRPRPRPVAVDEDATAPAPEPVAPPDPGILWPSLAGLFSDNGTSTAVLAIDDTVEFVSVNQRIGDFVVVTIGAASIELRHVTRNASKTLTLR